MVRNNANHFLFMLLSAIILRLLSNPFANVLQKKLVSKGVDASFVNFLTYLFLGLVSVPAFFFCDKTFTVEFWSCCVLGGALGAFSNFFMVRALELSDLSVLGPINAYKSLVGILFGILLLGEFPTFLGLSGVIMIIAGSYFLTDTPSKIFSFDLFRQLGIRYRFYALFLAAVEAIFIKKVILLTSEYVAFSSWACFGCLFALIIARQRSASDTLSMPLILKVLTISLLFGIMQLSTNFVFAKMNVGYALAIFQLSGVISVLLGFLFFKERHIFRKLFASLIMCVGAGIIFVGL